MKKNYVVLLILLFSYNIHAIDNSLLTINNSPTHNLQYKIISFFANLFEDTDNKIVSSEKFIESSTIKVLDNSFAPTTISCPSDIAIDCSDSSLPSNTGNPTASDPGCITFNYTHSDVITAGTCSNSYTITRTWRATETCTNTSFDECDQIITVNDNTAPTFTKPVNITINSDSNCNYNATVGITGDVLNENDNCGVGQATFTDVITNVNPGQKIITRTWNLVDNCGNAATNQLQIITVLDNIPPTVPVLPDITAQCSVTVTAQTANDNCDGVITGTTGDPLTYNIQGSYIIYWKFEDSNGNFISTIPQNVIIDDTLAPVPDIASLPTINEGCELASITPPTATDNCSGVINGTTSTTFPITTQGTTIITWTYDDGEGNVTTQTQTVILAKPSISGGVLLGYVSNLAPLLPPDDNIAIFSCPGLINPITIDLSGEIGTVVHWEKFEAGDVVWTVFTPTNLNQITPTFDFNNTKSTLYRVLVQVGSCTEYSEIVNVHAIPPDVPPVLEEDYFNICLTEPVSLIATSGYTSSVEVEDGGDFNSGQFPDKWNPDKWRIDGQTAGAQWTASGNNTKFNNWSGTNDHPVGTLYEIEYDIGNPGKKFGIAHGDFTSAAYIAAFPPGNPTTLETPIFSLEGLGSASVDFDQAFNLEDGDFALLELSLDGGATYTITLQELYGTSSPTLTWDWASHPPSKDDYYMFANDNSSFDISDYIGNDNVRVRWTFYGTTDESTWAIDNITIPVAPYSDELEWTDGLGEPGEYIVRGNLNVEYTFTPASPGVHQYGATSLINGCRAYDPDGTSLATVEVNYSYAGQDISPAVGECGNTWVNLNAFDNTLTAAQNIANGAINPSNPYATSDDPGTNASGVWGVSSSSTCGGASFSDNTDPRATFTGEAGVHILTWTVAGCVSTVEVTLSNCNVVDFDGGDDYINFKNNYDLNASFSIEAWIKRESQPASPPSNIQTIISKRDEDSQINGYDLRLVGSTLSFNWNNGGSIVSPYPINIDRWYHIAITRGNNIYRLYVDGIEVKNSGGSAPVANSRDFIVGAMDQTGNPPNKPVNYFSGWLDELRIWNKALDPQHIRQMMNQEIVLNGTDNVRGTIIPININGPDNDSNGTDDNILSWSNLEGYYRMDQIDCGYLEPYNGVGVNGKLRNITTVQPETAPLPYVSVRNGDWTNRTSGVTPWEFGDSVWDYPNSTGFNNTPIDWNIVIVSNNIDSDNQDITLLGLLTDTGTELTISNPNQSQNENNNGQGLWVTHYLKLDGQLDLVGESQLVQKRYTTNQFSESILDVTSAGYLERDQQGTSNLFNYNYWSSPVGPINTVSNNGNYTVGGCLLDGTNSASPGTISWITNSYDASGSVPIGISNRWIYTYINKPSEDYYNWEFTGNAGSVPVGLGYTMKGSGVASSYQNYVYLGKPNNANITSPVGSGNQALVGNPYPSAVDANEFISDNGPGNENSIDGSLYFWEHYVSNLTHITELYEGGYATYNLTGGNPAIQHPDLIVVGDLGTITPSRYVPIGQAFYVTASASGGNVLFENDQRFFEREAAASSVFLRSNISKPGNEDNQTIKRVRIDFKSSEGTLRPLLLGFIPNKLATENIDYGYDALNTDDYPDDMSWIIENDNFTVQGVGNYDETIQYPLGIFLTNAGSIEISLRELENFSTDIDVYIYDSLLSTYSRINDINYEFNLDAGDYLDRFYLTFVKEEDSLDIEEHILDNNQFIVNYLNDTHELYIKTPKDIDVKQVYLLNILGQNVKSWNSTNVPMSHEIRIPVKNISDGNYIIKVETSAKSINKKVIIKL